MVLWHTLPLGYQVETPPVGHYREYLPPPPPQRGIAQNYYNIYISTLMAEVTENINVHLILCYQVVTSSESW